MGGKEKFRVESVNAYLIGQVELKPEEFLGRGRVVWLIG
jgi:hypothetical protein